MSAGSIILWLVIVTAFVVLNGLFVAAEFAVIRLRKSRVEELVKSGSVGSGTLRDLQQDMDNSIAGAQLGITLSSLVVGWMGERAVSGAIELVLNAIPGFEHLHVPGWVGFVLAFVLLSMAHIIIGEQVPKFLGIRFPETTLMKLGVPFRIFCVITRPFLLLMNSMSNAVIRMMGYENRKEEHKHPTAREFQIMVEESAKAGSLGKQESDLLVRALELKALAVRDVMRPKTKVDYLRSDSTLAQVMKLVVETKHSKLPVFDANEHKVVGILSTKDLFDVWMTRFDATKGGVLPVPADLQAFKLSRYVRQAHYVPDTMQASTLLEEMRSKRLQMAMVTDEFGNTIGIVTLEDLVEQLVGEIWDEYDKPNANFSKVAEDTWRVSGEVTVFEFSKSFPQVLEYDGYATTVAGMAVETIGHQPKVGETVSICGLTFKIIEKEGQRISILEVQVSAPQSEV